MKVPDSGQPQPPTSKTSTDKPATTGQPRTSNSTTQSASTNASARAEATISARQLLDQLQLRQGQQVLARVAQVLQKTSSAPEQLLLDVRGKPLVTDSVPQLKPGDWVRMQRAGNELRLISQLQTQGSPQARIAQQLAQHLPWQHRLDQGLAQLASAIGRGGQQGASSAATSSPLQNLPAGVRESIQSLLQNIPRAENLTSTSSGTKSGNDSVQTLRSWLRDSGLFTEARLAQAPKDAQSDFKVLLARVVDALLHAQGTPKDASQAERTQSFNRYVPLTSQDLVQAPLQFPQASSAPAQSPSTQDSMTTGQMLRLLAGMLNRVNVNQLHSQVLAARTGAEGMPGPAVPTWLMELPWVDTNDQARMAQMRLERHDPDEEASNRPKRKVAQWRLTLAMDLEEAGPVTFEMSLQNQQVTTRIWAERTETLKRANEDLPFLRQRLDDLGLEVVELECRRGKPQGAKTQLDHRLVDTRA